MRRLYFLQLLFFFCLLLLSACSKDSPAPVESSYIGNGYIKGSFGSEYLNYTKSTFAGVYDNFYDPNMNGGQLSIIRSGKGPDYRILQLGISGINLDSIQTPYEISINASQPGKVYPLHGTVGHSDLSFKGIIQGAEDSINYIGHTVLSEDVLTIRIDSKENDILEGSFSGTMRTATGLEKQVTNGEFKVKIVREK